MAITTPTFSNGAAISATDLNTAISEIETYVSALGNGQLSRDAGITSEKLQDRYGVWTLPVTLLGPSAENTTDPLDLANMDMFVCPTNTSADTSNPSGTLLQRVYPEIPSSKRTYLVSVSLFATEMQTDTDNPVVWVYHNGTLLSGGGATFTNRGPWYLRNASPFAAPLVAMQTGDYIEFHLGRSGSSGTPDIRGLSATLTFKSELSA